MCDMALRGCVVMYSIEGLCCVVMYSIEGLCCVVMYNCKCVIGC